MVLSTGQRRAVSAFFATPAGKEREGLHRQQPLPVQLAGDGFKFKVWFRVMNAEMIRACAEAHRRSASKLRYVGFGVMSLGQHHEVGSAVGALLLHLVNGSFVSRTGGDRA